MGDEIDELPLSMIQRKIDDSIRNNTLPFKYQNLMDQIDTYKLSETPLDIKIHKIDDFMVDVYRTLRDMESVIRDTDIVDMDEDDMMSNLMKDGIKLFRRHCAKLRRIIGQIMLNYEFTETEIRGIQWNYLKDMLNESIQNEDFELSALIRDRINNFF
jgi:hypothetical protein